MTLKYFSIPIALAAALAIGAPASAQRGGGGHMGGGRPGSTVGTAQSYSPSSAPLTLAPDLHHVVIVRPGYQSMTFDSDVTAGRQVIPYQGTMQPQ